MKRKFGVLRLAPSPNNQPELRPSSPDTDQHGEQDAHKRSAEDPSEEEPHEAVWDEPPEAPEAQTPPIDFVTLGMLIIDDIDLPPPTQPARDVLGGAGSYAALGARLFSPPPLSESVGWIVDQGSDFPAAAAALVDSWATSAVKRLDTARLTTRGWNGYQADADHSQTRAFRYKTPKKRLTAADLPPALLRARAFHLICSPARCRELVSAIHARRSLAPGPLPRPFFLWEPVPDLCTPDELLNCTNTLPLVDVCSPNHAELANFMAHDGLDPATGAVSTSAVEEACEQLLASMPLQSYAIVVRAGEHGCYLAKNAGARPRRRPARATRASPAAGAASALSPDTDLVALFSGLMRDVDGSLALDEAQAAPGLDCWIPAYHQRADRVLDPTGGGNTFLGAMGVALARGESLEDAALWGSVAASFAIEQVGMPTLGRDEEGNETWNGESVQSRLQELRHRLQPQEPSKS